MSDRRKPDHEPMVVKTLAMALPQETYRTVSWRKIKEMLNNMKIA